MNARTHFIDPNGETRPFHPVESVHIEQERIHGFFGGAFRTAVILTMSVDADTYFEIGWRLPTREDAEVFRDALLNSLFNQS